MIPELSEIGKPELLHLFSELRIPPILEVLELFQLAVDGAFGSYSEASGGRLASLAYPPPPLASLAPPA